jgi:release factor glutamine methyltransferase
VRAGAGRTSGGSAAAAAPGFTLREALAGGAERLRRDGLDTPRLDAEVLLAWVLGCDRAALVLRAREPLAPEQAQRFEAALARRAEGEPVAYITGVKEFRRIALHVDPRVLIPRPETELLVEVGAGLPAGARVHDVGTGSGAVALALAHERPDLRITGSDVSVEAVALARENAARLGLQVRFDTGDLLDGIEREGLDAVLANLPYVALGDPALAPSVARFEPGRALYGGEDGLAVLRRLAAQLDEVPVVALEVGSGQAPAVQALLEGAGFAQVERLRDLAGHERVVVGRR